MQQKFRERLHARTSGMIEQMNAKPAKSQADSSSEHPSQTPQNSVHSGTPTASSNSPPAQSNHPIQHEQQQGAIVVEGERSYITDWLIALIVLAIAAILYRRAGSFLSFWPDSIANRGGGNNDDSSRGGGVGSMHDLDDM